MTIPQGSRDNQLLEAAIEYAGRGWRVLPLHSVVNGQCSCGDETGKCKPGKHPLTFPGMYHGAKEATTDPSRIADWWATYPSANVAIATGEASGVFVVGPDGQGGIDALADLERRYGALPETPTARTGGGGHHRYYRWPASGGVSNRQKYQGLPIDVRGEGGYAVAPPSQNGTGPYTWVVPPDAVEVAEAPAWLLDWLKTGKLPEVRVMVLTVQPDTEARAVAYLAQCPPAISGQGGHDQTFEVARAIVYGFDLGPEVGYRILAEHYNPRCVPAWSEGELRHKCAEADSKPFDKPRGYLLHSQPSGQVSAANGAAAIAGEAVLQVRCLHSVQPEPVEYLVEGYIPLGKVTLFAGCGGMGKSVATLDVTAAVTTGRCAFGLQYTPPPPADVLLCFAEDDAGDTVVPRLLAAGADLRRVHEVQGVRGADGKRRPFSLADCAVLAKDLERRPEAKLVVIDPAGVFAGRTGIDTHKEAPVQAMLAELRDLAMTRRVAVVLVAHVNKSEEQKARNRVSGSAAFVNSARGAFLFTEDAAEDGRRLLLPIKCNFGREPQGLIYSPRSLTEEEVAAVQPALTHLTESRREELLAQLFRLEWRGQTTEKADEVLARRKTVQTDADRAADWLRVFLALRPVSSEECVAKGNQAVGLTKPAKWWRESVLKNILCGTPRRSGFGADGQWFFTLPNHPWPFPGLGGAEDGDESPSTVSGSPPLIEATGTDGSPSIPTMDSLPSMASMDTPPGPQEQPPTPSIEVIEDIEAKEAKREGEAQGEDSMEEKTADGWEEVEI
jgi:hypothetical protein